MQSSAKVRRWAAALQVLSVVLLVVLSLALAAGILFLDVPEDIRKAAGLGPDRDIGALRVAAALAGALPALAMLWALGHTRALFACYARGETLTLTAAGHIHRIGVALVTSAALGLVARPLQILLASLANPPGDRVLALGIGGNDIGLILAGGLMLSIGWVMRDAARIAEDNAGIV